MVPGSPGVPHPAEEVAAVLALVIVPLANLVLAPQRLARHALLLLHATATAIAHHHLLDETPAHLAPLGPAAPRFLVPTAMCLEAGTCRAGGLDHPLGRGEEVTEEEDLHERDRDLHRDRR